MDESPIRFTGKQIVEDLCQTTVGGQIYHVPVEFLNGIYRSSGIPPVAYIVTPLDVPLPVSLNARNTFTAVEITEKKTLAKIASQLRTDKGLDERIVMTEKSTSLGSLGLPYGLHTRKSQPIPRREYSPQEE